MHTHGAPYTPDKLIEVAATQALLQALAATDALQSVV